MHTRVQLASERMGSELSARPARRFPITSAHMTAIEMTEIAPAVSSLACDQ